MVMMLKKLNPFAGERLDIVSEHEPLFRALPVLDTRRCEVRVWTPGFGRGSPAQIACSVPHATQCIAQVTAASAARPIRKPCLIA